VKLVDEKRKLVVTRGLKAAELNELAGLPRRSTIRGKRRNPGRFKKPPVGLALLTIAIVAFLNGNHAEAGGLLFFYWQTRNP
jgi:hypothetical protein